MPTDPESTSTFPDLAQVRTAVASLRHEQPEAVLAGVPLSSLTTFGIGGPACGVCRIRNTADAVRFQAAAREMDLPFFCLGGGSNVLASDRGFGGLLFKMEIPTCVVQEATVTVGAGVNLDELVQQTLRASLVGLEFASGIPGTFGGALVGNAGCYGHEIGELVTRALLLRPDGTLETVGPAELTFAYRDSALKTSGDLLLEATLELQRADPAAAWRTRAENLERRREKLPTDIPCAGSYFKNLPPAAPGEFRRSAGELLDRAGAKSLRVGDAAVFAKHANIIINQGQATSAEVLALADRMKATVRRKFGLELEEEVRYLPWQPPRRG